MEGVRQVLRILVHPRKSTTALSRLWSTLFNPTFFLLPSLACLSIPNPFLFGLQGRDSVEVSISKLDTGYPFSSLNPGSGKLLISQAFALDFPQRWRRRKKMSSWSDSGEMGRMNFPSLASSSSPPHRLHPQCTPTHHLCLFFFSHSLAYAALFWSLALVLTVDWQSWQFP